MLLKFTMTEQEKICGQDKPFPRWSTSWRLKTRLFRSKKTKRCDLKDSSHSKSAFPGDLRTVETPRKVRQVQNGDLDCGPPLHSLVSKAACGVAAWGMYRLSSVVWPAYRRLTSLLTCTDINSNIPLLTYRYIQCPVQLSADIQCDAASENSI